MLKKLCLSLAALFLCVACNEKKDEHNMLVIGTSGDNPPFEFYEKGGLTGFDMELGRLLAHKLGREVKIVDMSFDTLIAALQTKKIDIALSAIAPTEERAKAVDFSSPYHESSSVLVTVGFTDVTDVSHLKNHVIGVQLGSTHEYYAKGALKKAVNIEIRSLGKVTDLIQELKTQRIAGLVTGAAEAMKIIELNPDFKLIKLPESSEKYAAALPKGSALTKAVDDALVSIEADGTLQRLRKKWKVD